MKMQLSRGKDISSACPKTGRSAGHKCRHRWLGWLFPITGLLALIWFLVRVIPKPSRATYPCQRVAFPVALSFAVWLLGLGCSVLAIRNVRERIRESRYMWAAICVCVAMAGAWVGVFGTDGPPASAYLRSVAELKTVADPVNDPIGEPKGCNPGRVVWVYDPDATDWDGPGSDEFWWEPQHTNQGVVDDMMSRSIRWLAGRSTEAEAWEALFRYFNREHRNDDRGYQLGEKIAIKVNLTTCNTGNGSVDPDTREKISYLDKTGDSSPQMILALLRQLANVVGVQQANISVGDTVAYFPKQWHDHLAPEFPDVHYLDHYAFPGRTKVQYSTTPFYWSTAGANGKVQDYLPVSFAEADYIINLAVLKSHMAGITVCAKNHYGSLIRTPIGRVWGELKDYYNLHDSLPYAGATPGRGHYRALVDLMGHADLGAKTVLYLIDGLYGGHNWEGTPEKWKMHPFNDDWSSSLFASQDPVAIDSVAYGFLLEEWPEEVDPGSMEGGAQDYLHEAALADNPPSGTFYDPENDGTAMESLGVHEHWNNPDAKQYSRNLGTGDGIELISSDPNAVATVVVAPDFDIIPRGGTLGFEVTIANNTDKAGLIYFATNVTLPNGNIYPASGYLFGPRKVTLTPYQSKSGHLSHTIPTGAPLGTYIYHAYIGRPGMGLIDEDQFDFEVVEAPAFIGTEDWETTVDEDFTETE